MDQALGCIACARHVSYSTAAVFDLSESTLKSGLCYCVLHISCSSYLKKDDTLYHCYDCLASTRKIQKLSTHNCMLCHMYASSIFCASCILSLRTNLQSQCNLAAVDMDIFLEESIVRKLKTTFTPYKHIFKLWLYKQVRERTPTLTYVLDQGLFPTAWTSANLVCALWQTVYSRTNIINIKAWTCYHRNSQLARFVSLSEDTIRTCIGRIEHLIPTSILSGDILHAKPSHTISNKRESLFILGSRLVASGLYNHHNAMVLNGLWQKIFLNHLNDSLYFQSPCLSALGYIHSIDPQIAPAWLTFLSEL